MGIYSREKIDDLIWYPRIDLLYRKRIICINGDPIPKKLPSSTAYCKVVHITSTLQQNLTTVLANSVLLLKSYIKLESLRPCKQFQKQQVLKECQATKKALL